MTTDRWQAVRRQVAAGILLIALLLAVVATRLLIDGHEAMSQGAALERDGKRAEAVAAYRDAARAYVPLSPYSSLGFERLFAIGKQAQEQGDVALARLAFETFRGAALSIRSVYTPHRHELVDVNRRLSELYALRDASQAGSPDSARPKKYFADLLSAPVGPSLPRAVGALLGLGLWISAVIAFLFLGLDQTLRPKKPVVLGSGIAFAVGVALFAWGLLGGGSA
jgi:hypothetical protein